MIFYQKNKGQDTHTEDSMKVYIKECREAPEYQDETEIVKKFIYCNTCEKKLFEFLTPVGELENKVIIDGYWHIYIADTKKVFCNSCKKMFDTDKIDTKLFDCPNCKSVISDYRPIERFYTKGLLAYENRKDGNIGLECSCGEDTTTDACEDSEKATLDSETCPFRTETEE